MISNKYKIYSDIELSITHFTPHANKNVPTVICIHPTGFVSDMYASLAAHLRNINIFSLDLRSHGNSQQGNVKDWSHLGNDLFAVFDFLKRFTNQNKFFGVGISSGSSSLAMHAAKYPNDFHGLYLCEPIIFPPDTELKNREFLALSARNRRDTFKNSLEVYERFSSRGVFSTLDRSTLALYSKYGFKKNDSGITLKCKKEDEESIYNSGTSNDVWRKLKSITARTIIVYGEKSNTMNKKQATEIAAQIPNSKIEMHKNVGHFTLFENPTLGAESIERFIRSTS